MSNHEILGLDPSQIYSDHDIQAAYRKKAMKTHPDKHPPSQRAQRTREFHQLSNAYNALLNAKRVGNSEKQATHKSSHEEHRYNNHYYHHHRRTAPRGVIIVVLNPIVTIPMVQQHLLASLMSLATFGYGRRGEFGDSVPDYI